MDKVKTGGKYNTDNGDTVEAIGSLENGEKFQCRYLDGERKHQVDVWTCDGVLVGADGLTKSPGDKLVKDITPEVAPPTPRGEDPERQKRREEVEAKSKAEREAKEARAKAKAEKDKE